MLIHQACSGMQICVVHRFDRALYLGALGNMFYSNLDKCHWPGLPNLTYPIIHLYQDSNIKMNTELRIRSSLAHGHVLHTVEESFIFSDSNGCIGDATDTNGRKIQQTACSTSIVCNNDIFF